MNPELQSDEARPALAPWDAELVPAPMDHAWMVIHARPRCEKKAADFCARERMPAYLPLLKKTHKYGRRRREFMSPLFPGYVFCVASAQQASTLRQNDYVANLLTVLDQSKLVSQLQQIQKALSAAGNVIEVMPYLEVGKRVRVSAGPFKGLEGMVVRVKGKTRVVVNVDMIQQSVAFEVDTSDIKPL